MQAEDGVILVDEMGNEVGSAQKMEAHRKGLLHRAFSIFIFDRSGNVLLQKRAAHKYHSGGLWANTCCSHPRPGESLSAAAHRRLQEEMGFDCTLQEVFSFSYRADFSNGLIEHEYDHVFVGRYKDESCSGEVLPNPEEVERYEWRPWDEVVKDVQNNPERYVVWLRLIIEMKKSLRECL